MPPTFIGLESYHIELLAAEKNLPQPDDLAGVISLARSICYYGNHTAVQRWLSKEISSRKKAETDAQKVISRTLANVEDHGQAVRDKPKEKGSSPMSERLRSPELGSDPVNDIPDIAAADSSSDCEITEEPCVDTDTYGPETFQHSSPPYASADENTDTYGIGCASQQANVVSAQTNESCEEWLRLEEVKRRELQITEVEKRLAEHANILQCRESSIAIWEQGLLCRAQDLDRREKEIAEVEKVCLVLMEYEPRVMANLQQERAMIDFREKELVSLRRELESRACLLQEREKEIAYKEQSLLTLSCRRRRYRSRAPPRPRNPDAPTPAMRAKMKATLIREAMSSSGGKVQLRLSINEKRLPECFRLAKEALDCTWKGRPPLAGTLRGGKKRNTDDLMEFVD